VEPKQTSTPIPWNGQNQDLSISVSYTQDTAGRIIVKGKTNLPSTTILMISLDSKATGSNPLQTKATVQPDGTFTSPTLGPESGIEAGQYTINVTLPIAHTQPQPVRLLIGEKAENLRGSLVEQMPPFGNVANAKLDLVIEPRIGATAAVATAHEAYMQKSLLDVATAQSRYLDKKIRLPRAVIELSTYFNYEYRDMRSSFVAFEVNDGTARAFRYAAADDSCAEKLRQRILAHGPIVGSFVFEIRASRYDSASPDILADLVEYSIPIE